MRRQKIIRTNNREIYEKFNMLNFSSEILLKNVGVDNRQLNRILKNINNNSEVLEATNLGDFVLVKKKAPLNFKVYLKKGTF